MASATARASGSDHPRTTMAAVHFIRARGRATGIAEARVPARVVERTAKAKPARAEQVVDVAGTAADDQRCKRKQRSRYTKTPARSPTPHHSTLVLERAHRRREH